MKKLKICIGFLFLIFFSGCVHLVSYYDALSYKNLTDLKGETKVFFDACKQDIPHGEEAWRKVNGFVLSSAKAYEYEKGKNLNDHTVAQLEIIEKTITEVKLRYAYNSYDTNKKSCDTKNADGTSNESSGCLTKGYCAAKWLVLKDAFDIAISTERSKLKQSNWR